MVCDGNNDCWDNSDEAAELQCGEIAYLLSQYKRVMQEVILHLCDVM